MEINVNSMGFQQEDNMRRTLLVGEIGINHNGELKIVKQLIDAASFIGLDCVKFQKRTIDLVYTEEELNSYRESPWGITFRHQKEGLEFGKIEYDEIDRYCRQKGIEWFASPWDNESVEFLMNYNCPYTKIPSPLITNFDLLKAVKQTRRPVIISTGMSTLQEVRSAVDYLHDQIKYILACTSTYPTPLEEVNLSFVGTLKRDFPEYRVGYSSHSPGILFPAVSIAYGAQMVEFHITLDRAMGGSDQAASIEVGAVMKLVKYVRHLEIALGSGYWQVFPGELKIKER